MQVDTFNFNKNLSLRCQWLIKLEKKMYIAIILYKIDTNEKK